ncbi:MAG TPA: AsmA-like C-terminal region-containing protein, partial [Steroidobacteraceae bacterium]|nr:AsmA-like C-terminal region-containing protein [Steroidobacteraceae bacterium]
QDFTVKSLAMQGNFLGGRFNVKGGAEGRYYGRGAGMQLSATGVARSAELAHLLHLPSSIALGGEMQWQLRARQARHAPDEFAERSCTIESDTKGMSIGLPAPIGKSADTVRPLRFDIDAPDDNQVLLHGSFGETRVLMRVAKGEEGFSLDRGGVRVDGQAAALPAHPGIRIEGNIERFVLDDWLKMKGDGSGKNKLSDYLRAANVRVGSFGFLGYTWTDVRTILQAGDESWRVDVAGEDVTGQLSIPYAVDAQPLKIELAKLNVGEHVSEHGGDASRAHGDEDPRELPAITGRVDEFSLDKRRVGAARFNLEKSLQGVKLTIGELRGPSFTATAQGTWLYGSDGTPTASLTLDVASTDVRETLRAFNFHDVISGKRANAHVALTWPGVIDENLLSRSSGSVKIEISDGQLLDVEPGPARLLGLMSIAALPRRLALDFGDVTEKGFRFDIAKADFELKNGDAYTNNLLLRGPAAEVGIVGRTGLAKRDYDLTAAAAGDIGGSLSVASTVVGGPVVGAAVLAFTRLFKEPLKGVTRRYYRIEGPWDNARIERIDKQEAKQDAAESAQDARDSGKKSE